ncbi:MAG: peptidoglycan-binding protein [Clostridiales bacterium]|nr:peptidoglycan-binding protein [Clostridiales bacterium]
MTLTPGTYRIKVETTWDTNWSDFVVYQQDFTVVKKHISNQTQSQSKYATVTVIHKLVDDGQELRRETKQLAPGTHTLYADYPVGTVAEVYGSSSRIVAVGSNGVADTNTVVFQYKLLKKDNPQNDPTQAPTDPTYKPPTQFGNAYDIGVPNLNGNVYYQDNMNVHVLWVHYQLKATGMYYQGDSWDETGNLGDRTMREIGKFMQDNGYRNHDGHVDQTVINTLANYLGNRRVPVYVGGFYEKMNTIMTGGSAGSMQAIDENSSATRVKWVQMCLQKLGYYNSSIDGKFGSGTIKALKRFQADCGYVQRDYVTLGVARAMLELCYHRGCNLSDLP